MSINSINYLFEVFCLIKHVSLAFFYIFTIEYFFSFGTYIIGEIMQKPSTEFVGVRKYLWPVHFHELQKVIPMFLMFWGIVFNYSLLRQLKDAQVLTFGGVGGPIILFLKMSVFGSALLFTLLFTKLSKQYSLQTLFYGIVMTFFVFFVTFCFVIFPNREYVILSGLHGLLSKYIKWTWMQGGLAALKHWDISLFYIASELWGSVVLSLLFWGFANSISSLDESKRFYAFFTVGGNISVIAAGKMIAMFSSYSITYALKLNLPQNSMQAWMPTLRNTTFVFMVNVCIIIFCYYWLTSVCGFCSNTKVDKSKKKPKIGVIESLKIASVSPYVRYLAGLVVSYGLCINLVEVMWKDRMTTYFGGGNRQAEFTGNTLALTGLLSVFVSLFVSHNILRMFPWIVNAMITPIILGGTGVLFTALSAIDFYYPNVLHMLNISNPAYLIVILGSFQNIISKAIKYAIFDPVKEGVFVQSNDETIMTVGKLVVDVVFARFGKLIAAPAHIVGIMIFGGLPHASGMVSVILLIVSSGWGYCVIALDKLLSKQRNSADSSSCTDDADDVSQQPSSVQSVSTNNSRP